MPFYDTDLSGQKPSKDETGIDKGFLRASVDLDYTHQIIQREVRKHLPRGNATVRVIDI